VVKKRWYLIVPLLLIVLLPLIGYQSIRNVGISVDIALEDTSEMGGAQVSDLFVEPETVQRARTDFVKKLRYAGKNKRPLYEEYINVIGANGILDGIEKLWPKCHSQAHDLGKIIFGQVHDIGKSLRICAGRCYSACMHGVLMEALTEEHADDRHIDIAALKPVMNALCYKNTEILSSYSPGDCAHGVGHALMFLAGYDIPKAVGVCAEFDNPAMEYYCATGAYMEYVGKHDREDAKIRSLFYPCVNNDYPAACLRYKMTNVVRRHYLAKKKIDELVHECEKLSGKFRLGCFHGLGNGHMWGIAHDKMSIKEVCLHGPEDEQFMCIEGAMERMGKYSEKRALEVCEELEGKNKETCLIAVEHKMYSMEKDFTLYLAE